ncbi:MAG: HTTM domain-containing protein [Alphaproteobacteria bacterium]|nr:HTTM domain-containing protein [Alphaproteobacteria bacterium]
MNPIRTFWTWLFRPIPALNLGWMRLSLGILLIIVQLSYAPGLERLIGPEGYMGGVDLARYYTADRFSIYDYASNGTEMWIIWSVAMAVIVAFTAGFLTPVSGALTVVAMLSLHHSNPYVQNGGDRVLRLYAMYMTLSPCGRALSVDAWIRSKRIGKDMVSPLASAWPLRVIQTQTVLIYLWTGIGKATGVNWQDGTALYNALSLETYSRWPVVTDAILSTWIGQAATVFLTYATLIWEIAFSYMLLIPSLRVPSLIMGVLLHGGIWLSMSVGLFSWAMVWGYVAFLDQAKVARFLQRFLPKARAVD